MGADPTGERNPPVEQIEGEPAADVQEPLLAGLDLPLARSPFCDVSVNAEGAVVSMHPSGDPYSIIPKSLLPDDLFTHRNAWRNALKLAMLSAPPPTEDQNDRAYWRHELEAFDRVSAMLDALVATRTA